MFKKSDLNKVCFIKSGQCDVLCNVTRPQGGAVIQIKPPVLIASSALLYI